MSTVEFETGFLRLDVKTYILPHWSGVQPERLCLKGSPSGSAVRKRLAWGSLSMQDKFHRMEARLQTVMGLQDRT